MCWRTLTATDLLEQLNRWERLLWNCSSLSRCQTCSFGVCVHHLLCVDGEQMDFGASFMNPRVDVSRDKECPDTFEVCCRPDQIDKNTTRGAIIQPPTQTTQCGNRNEEGVGFKMIGNTDEAEFGKIAFDVCFYAWLSHLNHLIRGISVGRCHDGGIWFGRNGLQSFHMWRIVDSSVSRSHR